MNCHLKAKINSNELKFENYQYNDVPIFNLPQSYATSIKSLSIEQKKFES